MADRTARLRALVDRLGDVANRDVAATIKLALGSALVSRSEARRLVDRLTEFTHVTRDFSGVEIVGQGFCDEVCRVFARAHPQVTIEPVGMNEAVAFMVARVRAT
jgi:STAS-like domain of unknown function (DUF4325)